MFLCISGLLFFSHFQIITKVNCYADILIQPQWMCDFQWDVILQKVQKDTSLLWSIINNN